MKKIILIAFMCMAAVPEARADNQQPPTQTQAQPQPQPQSQTQTQPQQQGVGDRYDLARKIVDAQITDEMRKKSTDTLPLMLTPLVLRDNPGQDQKINQIMQSTVVPVLASLTDDNMRRAAEQLAENFNNDELKQIYTFQSSPIGEKYFKFNMDSAVKLKDTAKAQAALKMQEAIRSLITQLKTSNMQVPKELAGNSP